MAGPAKAPADLFVVGANHKSSPVALRDRLFVEDAKLPAFYDAMRGAGIGQAIVLSTCDRVEIQGAHSDPAAASRTTVEWLARNAGLTTADLGEAIYQYRGADAARQIFAVAASLDSMMIGETQVAGQVRAGHRLARAAGMTGPELEAVLQSAYGAAKRIRLETSIGERPVSIAAAAVQLAHDVHGDLSRCAALLLGVGEMGESLVTRLREAGLSRLVITHPAASRAEATARRMGCHHHPFEQFAAAMPAADIVVTALGDGNTLISNDMMRQVLKARRRRPVFLIDAAVPTDIDPRVERLEDLFLYTLDDLEKVALSGLADREFAARAAWSILDTEVAAFLGGRRSRRAVPLLQSLRKHFENMRAEVLADGRADPAEATRRLINRLLHDPSEVMREMAGRTEDSRLAEHVIRRLFRLEVRSDEGTNEREESEE